MPFTFYLGAHHPHWLGRVDAPLFISQRSLRPRRTFPRASAPWALDSGGFSELLLHGRWTQSPAQYVEHVRRYRDEIGMLDWAAPQDWMCEPVMTAKTGLSVAEHQRRTITNLLELRSLAPELPIIPVLQGWTPGDYHDHLDAYARIGIDLTKEPVVGIGSVCRRQNTIRVSILIRELAGLGLRLHGFGFKRTGLRFVGDVLASADSMAWSYHARREPPLPECEGTHKNCANCPAFALEWRRDLLASLHAQDQQPTISA